MQGGRQALRPDIVVACQHGKSPQRSGNTHRREARVPGRRVGAAVVHCGAHCHAGRHLVVQQPADADTQVYAVWALGAIGDPEAVPTLVSLARSEDAGLRKAAVHALGSFPGDASRAALVTAVNDPVEDVRWNAAVALARRRDPEAAPVLLQMMDRRHLATVADLTGDALETSMDVEFTVDVIPGPARGGPRMENATHIMAMGLDGSIDGAFKSATANMASWLVDRYKLTPSEVAQVLGTAAEYRISEVADRNAGVVLKISKERLATLPSPAK